MLKDLKLTQDFIDVIENANKNIRVEFDFKETYGLDKYINYKVIFDESVLFKICISSIVFESGRVDLDYTLIADILSDSFQTQDITEFQKRVLWYIGEIV
jgi:hypothetical protein